MEDLLDRPAEEAIRRIALGHLEAAGEAAPRGLDPEDEEGLHDFRVAVRRLRSVLRAYSELLEDAVGKKLVRRLRDVARATGGGRDAEVARAWLVAERPRLGRRARTGVDWAAARLDRRLEAAAASIREGVSRFETATDKLHGRLVVYTAEVRLEPRREDTFAAVLAGRLERYSPTLVHRLAAIGGPGNRSAVHRARLAGKRLRYLVEGASPAQPLARGLVASLKGLQDLLGELHDAHVLEADLASWVEAAAADQARGLLAAALGATDAGTPSLRPWEVVRSLVALARANRERRDSLFGRLAAEWLSERGRDDFEARATQLAAALRGPAPEPEAPPLADGASPAAGA